jgi:di/tripeptidase
MMFGAYGANFHQADEWVDVNSIASVIRVLLRMTCQLLPATRS